MRNQTLSPLVYGRVLQPNELPGQGCLLILGREEGRRRGRRGRDGEHQCARNMDQLSPVSGLPKDRTCSLLVYRMMFQPTEPPSQGKNTGAFSLSQLAPTTVTREQPTGRPCTFCGASCLGGICLSFSCPSCHRADSTPTLIDDDKCGFLRVHYGNC